MLSALFVSDLALIKRLSVDFHRGFSVLTGETGAGKSLILDSLNLFLARSAPKDLVRHGEEKLEVNLFFDSLSPEALALLEDVIPPEEAADGVTLSRVVYAEGRSVTKLNGRTLPFSRISQIAKGLLAIHGQHDSGGLLEEKNHRLYLDSALGDLGQAALEEYARLWREYSEEKKRLSELEDDVGDEKEKLALYDFQMKEIAKVKPQAGEDEALEERLKFLQNQEKYFSALSTAHRALSGGEKGKGAVFLLSAAARKLEALGESAYGENAGRLYELAREAEEICRTLGEDLSQMGAEDPGDEVDRIHRRMDALYRLKLKYGATVDEVISYYETLKEKKDLTLSRKDDIKKSKAVLAELEKKLSRAAEVLSRARREVAEKLEREIHFVLAFLDMPKMVFSVSLTPLEALSAHGAESVRFLIAANTGEGKKPLSQVASGGELSRIMLALQLRLGNAKDADTLVFDEIDTGISGSTAQKIGLCLKKLAETKQIFCVTHSAQVATLADRHYRVEKSEDDGRTQTSLSLLEDEDSILEVARILGGKDVSPEAVRAARELRREGERELEQLKDILI